MGRVSLQTPLAPDFGTQPHFEVTRNLSVEIRISNGVISIGLVRLEPPFSGPNLAWSTQVVDKIHAKGNQTAIQQQQCKVPL